jgi:hypothetical protein
MRWGLSRLYRLTSRTVRTFDVDSNTVSSQVAVVAVVAADSTSNPPAR